MSGVADSIDGLARAVRGDSPLAGDSTIPDNLAEIVMALRRFPDAISWIPEVLDHNFTSPNELDRNGEPANVVDGLFAIARGLNRIADALEREGT